MRKLLAIIVCCFSLVGCGTINSQAQNSQAQMERERIASTHRSTVASWKMCKDEAKKSELYKKIYEEVFFETDESRNKYAMLANKNKLTNEQLELLKEGIPTITQCRTVLIDGYRNTPFLIPLLKSFNEFDAMVIKLIKGEMTIGDANEERVKIEGRIKLDWASTASELDTHLSAMHNSEMQGRAQAAAAQWNMLMQLQQNQAFQQQQQQQQFYQQQMQSLRNNPAFRSPTTTNCSTYGNQTNCTSR